jgi:hypothetical protein
MSSEISTDPHALQPWQFFTLAGFIGATAVVVIVGRGHTPSVVILLSLTVFAAAAVGVAAFRTLAPFSNPRAADAPQILGGRTRAALEREKALALRSIKELEFDRAMGKVSEKDFNEMSARLRVRATRILRQLDAGTGYREQIDKEIEKRVGRTAPAGATRVSETAPHTARAVALECACGTRNDADARFCKSCGATLGASA